MRGNMVDGMKKGLLQYTKFVGPVSPEAGAKSKRVLRNLGSENVRLRFPRRDRVGQALRNNLSRADDVLVSGDSQDLSTHGSPV